MEIECDDSEIMSDIQPTISNFFKSKGDVSISESLLNTQTKKRERISPIWGYLKKPNHIKKVTASCNTCLKTLSTK